MKYIIGVILALVLAVGIINIFKDRSSVVDYSRECQQENVSAQNCTSWGSPSETTYYINKNTQQVFFDGSNGPVPFSKCYVVDAENWSCNEGQIGFDHGRVVDHSFSSSLFAVQHFGQLQYWWYKL